MKHLDFSNQALTDYVLQVGLRESPIERRLREETAGLPRSGMQLSPDQGQLLGFLLGLMRARAVLEIGTFTGYSALTMARALPPDGRLVTCDLSSEWTQIAARYWREAGVAERIDLRLAPALKTLDSLIDAGEESSFDLAFIDADKESYDAYYERCLVLIRPGGLIAIDNVLWGGAVTEPDSGDADTRFIDALNRKIRDDDRVDTCLVPIGDGMTLVRRR